MGGGSGVVSRVAAGAGVSVVVSAVIGAGVGVAAGAGVAVVAAAVGGAGVGVGVGIDVGVGDDVGADGDVGAGVRVGVSSSGGAPIQTSAKVEKRRTLDVKSLFANPIPVNTLFQRPPTALGMNRCMTNWPVMASV